MWDCLGLSELQVQTVVLVALSWQSSFPVPPCWRCLLGTVPGPKRTERNDVLLSNGTCRLSIEEGGENEQGDTETRWIAIPFCRWQDGAPLL